jgi:hypothetical protein
VGQDSKIPVVLFAYSRPNHLRQTLDCLRANRVPLIYAFSDGPKSKQDMPKIEQVRKILRSIDWCEIKLCEREANLGLGRSILTGVTDVLNKHDAAIVFEDDLICVPGTYGYLCAALKYYQDDPRVMSVTGWTHPLIMPRDVTDQPYFDGRAECWVWGTWSGAWKGMETDAKTLMKQCTAKGLDIYRYGADLVSMAEAELTQNIWAVRFLYWHILNRGVCLRPPRSMVEHIGAGLDASNVTGPDNGKWTNPPLKSCPPIPGHWPPPTENPACSRLWQNAEPKTSLSEVILKRIIRLLRKGFS